MGPKCWDAEVLEQLLDAGLDVMRLNFSHGTHAGHLEVLLRFRQVPGPTLS
jgi:pyruvate kinase